MENKINKVLTVIIFTLVGGSMFTGAFYFRGLIDCPEDFPCSLPSELTKKYFWYFYGVTFVMSSILIFFIKETETKSTVLTEKLEEGK
jgi:hypothetical protein